jgi:hypothetical protein
METTIDGLNRFAIRDHVCVLASPPPLAQPLARVAARAEHTRPRGQRVATEDEQHRMVG